MTKPFVWGVLIAWAVGLSTDRAIAATSIVGGGREALVEVAEIRNWVVGADALKIRRDVDFDGSSEELDSDWYGVFLGFRPRAWLMLYGTLGRTTAETEWDDLDDGLGWSLGIHTRIWRYDLKDPEFLAGRWSVRAGGEFRRSDHDAGYWQTASASADLHYELFVDSPAATDRVPFSLGLYAGPLYSWLDGKVEGDTWTEDFEGDGSWGVAAGAEVHLSHNFLIGLQLEWVKATSWGVSARYTF